MLSIQCDAIRWEQFCGDVALDSINMVYMAFKTNEEPIIVGFSATVV